MDESSENLRMRRYATSSDGTRIVYWKTGRARGPALVFLHGFGLSHKVWNDIVADPQLRGCFQLITVDLRGHGSSENPRDRNGYQSGPVWADDLHAVIADAAIVRPVVVAWSYGARLLNDYLRYHGTGNVGGINYIAAATVADPTTLGADHACLAQLCADDPALAAAARERFVSKVIGLPRTCVLYDALLEDLNSRGARHWRWLREKALDYEALLAGLTVPVLISHGAQDSLLNPRHARVLSGYLDNCRVSIMEGAGHAPFLSAPHRYVLELSVFARACLA